MDALPIDPLLPELARRLADAPALVLEAPPGAGKTTRVPRALLDHGLLERGEVIVLEPRRLAARLAARRVADELGERLGETVGYQVRFEDVSGPRTKIRFVTEGVLTRKLLGDPKLARTSAVLLDEFHERHLQGDLGLALLRRLQRTTRPDLKLVVMSATLQTGPVATYLEAETLRSEGRRFEVTVEHIEQPSQKRLEEQVANAVRRLVTSGLDGDVLVFLPGAAEIRRSMEACHPIAQSHDLLVLPLHGELSPEEQDRAIRPNRQRKVILSTNVAETSVTIDGVVAVIDSGLARVAGHSPWSGISTLKVAPVSKASATQRAGRAGRTRPGRCIRLYTKADFDQRPAHDEPEIRRLDLAQPILELHATGVDPRFLEWFDAPSAAGLDAAEGLLRQLGAVDANGKVTKLGQQLARLPVHPRLARLVVEATERGAAREACALAAILGERDLRERQLFGMHGRSRETVDSDPLEVLELFFQAQARDFSPDAARSLGLDPGGVRAADRARRQIERIVQPKGASGSWAQTEQALRMALLAAYPDRVAKRRDTSIAKGNRELVFANGGAGVLSDQSGVHAAPWIVAVDAEERRQDGAGRGGGVAVRQASAIDPDWLIELFAEQIVDRVDVEWDPQRERVNAVSRMKYGALVLDERVTDPTGTPEASQLLYEEAKAAGPRAFADAEALDRLLQRLSFIGRTFPESGVPALSTEALDRALREACEGRRSFADLREASLVDLLRDQAGGEHRLQQLAPESIQLPGGRRVKVNYEPDQPPWIASRLQDFFGMAQGPILGGRVPLVLHLLAPNQRAVQVSTDLAGFWARHYPGIRKELMRQYPRHSWPEDPLTASPPVPGARRHS